MCEFFWKLVCSFGNIRVRLSLAVAWFLEIYILIEGIGNYSNPHQVLRLILICLSFENLSWDFYEASHRVINANMDFCLLGAAGSQFVNSIVLYFYSNKGPKEINLIFDAIGLAISSIGLILQALRGNPADVTTSQVSPVERMSNIGNTNSNDSSTQINGGAGELPSDDREVQAIHDRVGDSQLNSNGDSDAGSNNDQLRTSGVEVTDLQANEELQPTVNGSGGCGGGCLQPGSEMAH